MINYMETNELKRRFQDLLDLGLTQDTLHRHYIDLATREDGEVYFSITPSTLDSLAESRGILGNTLAF